MAPELVETVMALTSTSGLRPSGAWLRHHDAAKPLHLITRF